MHIRHDIRQGIPAEQLEPALRVPDARRLLRRHEPQQQVEAVHEKVAQSGALDDRGRFGQVRAGTDSDAAASGVFDALACGEEGAEVGEAGGTVGVGEEGVAATYVAEAVGDGAAFAAVVLEGYYADGLGGDGYAVGGAVCPGAGDAAVGVGGCGGVDDVVAEELEGY